MDVPLYGLNFAYGSNLDERRLLSRCPAAELEGAVTLRGYRLEFYGAADLEPDEDGAVAAVAWRLMPEDERRLDRCEGIGRLGLPDSYVKIPVVAERLDGSEAAGYIYLMSRERRARDGRTPADDYYHYLASGYRQHGFDEASLRAALARAR
jgi:Gamma-glutamyl cyclotransferase, AIG2-like